MDQLGNKKQECDLESNSVTNFWRQKLNPWRHKNRLQKLNCVEGRRKHISISTGNLTVSGKPVQNLEGCIWKTEGLALGLQKRIIGKWGQRSLYLWPAEEKEEGSQPIFHPNPKGRSKPSKWQIERGHKSWPDRSLYKYSHWTSLIGRKIFQWEEEMADLCQNTWSFFGYDLQVLT